MNENIGEKVMQGVVTYYCISLNLQLTVKIQFAINPLKRVSLASDTFMQSSLLFLKRF